MTTIWNLTERKTDIHLSETFKSEVVFGMQGHDLVLMINRVEKGRVTLAAHANRLDAETDLFFSVVGENT